MNRDEDLILWRDFDELRNAELYQLLRLRQDVFILEQRSFYLDIDGKDLSARHLLLYPAAGDGKRLRGTLRLLPPGRDGTVYIGRVALAESARGEGRGARMMCAALGEAERLYGQASIALSAQSDQVAFYRRFGFVAVGRPFDDGGIPHIEMHRENSDL
jgi:ElaA protein